jgi:hypothetical protein
MAYIQKFEVRIKDMNMCKLRNYLVNFEKKV